MSSSTFDKHSLERGIYDAELQARRYGHAVAVCMTRSREGLPQYWCWPFAAAEASFSHQIFFVALCATHPSAAEKHRRNDEAARFDFRDWK